MRIATEEKPADYLTLLGSTGLANSELFWKEIVALKPGSTSRLVIFSLAAAPHDPIGEQRVRLCEEIVGSLGIATQTIWGHKQPPVETISLLQNASTILLMGDVPRAFLDISSTSIDYSIPERLPWDVLWQRHKAGVAVIAAGNVAAALGEFTFAPIKPYPPTLETLEFERLPGACLLPGTAILPYFDRFPDGLLSRLEKLFPPEIALVGIDEQAALISGVAGWRVAGLGSVTILRHNEDTFVAEAGMNIPDRLLLPYSCPDKFLPDECNTV